MDNIKKRKFYFWVAYIVPKLRNFEFPHYVSGIFIAEIDSRDCRQDFMNLKEEIYYTNNQPREITIEEFKIIEND
jgi:hypothetical protein